jgi:hypothetical protein
MVVWLTKEMFELQKSLKVSSISMILGRIDLQAIHAFFFGVHAAFFDDTQPNIDNVAVDHGVAGTAGVGVAAEEAQDNGLKTVGRVPISGHTLLVFFSIFTCYFVVLINEPIKQSDEDDVWIPEPHRLKGSVDWGRDIVKEDISLGCTYCDDVSSSLLVEGVSCF